VTTIDQVRFDCFPTEHGGFAVAPNVIGGDLVTSWPGGRIDPIRGGLGDHGGIDLILKLTLGAPFFSVLPGWITQGWDYGGGGWWTSLKTDDGHTVGYGHALSFEPGVNGTRVKAGQRLGLMDSTGASTGSHMHFALNVDSVGRWDDPVDPLRRCADAGRFPGAATPPVIPNRPTIPTSEEDDPMQLRWQENTGELYLVAGGVKIYIPPMSGGISADEMKAALIAGGAKDRTQEPGAAFLEAFPTAPR
jgi:hypothetical protein